MPTKAQLATDIMNIRALKSAPAPAPHEIADDARELARLTRMTKPALEALHAEYTTVSEDTALLAELVTEALQGHEFVVSACRETIRVEPAVAELCQQRHQASDRLSATLKAAGFTFNRGNATCFVTL